MVKLSTKANKKAELKPALKQIQNRRARFDYSILKTFEAGIALVGSEVKSIYLGRGHLADAFCRISANEAFLENFDVEPYEHSHVFAHDRRRSRKLLLHRKEIEALESQGIEKGLSIIPLRVYFSHGKVKVEIAIARGKKLYDKRDKIAEEDANRSLQRELSDRES